MLTRLKSMFLDILFPASCVSCDSEGSFLCDTCKQALPSLPPACIGCAMLTQTEGSYPAGRTCKRCRTKTLIRVFVSPFPYHHATVQRLIHEFKYHRIRSISPLLGEFIVQYMSYYQISLPEQAFIIPIPLHPRKERVRGFNQALLLAQEISRSTSLTIDTHTLIRTASTTPQTKLTASNRRSNVENIFALRDPHAVTYPRAFVRNARASRSCDTSAMRGKTIIIVDDVKTTGATLEQAARVLKNAGAKEIWAITFAH